VLIYALFPQIGLKFLENRGNPDAFEPPPGNEVAAKPAAAREAPAPASGLPEEYQVEVNGKTYKVRVSAAGAMQQIQPAAAPSPATAEPEAEGGRVVTAPLAGNIYKVKVAPGQRVVSGEVIMILEAMKMETEVRATASGVVSAVKVKEGDSVRVGDPLLVLG